MRPLIRHLRESGQLNAGLILRSLLSGNVELFEEALADLAQVPLARVVGIVHDRRGAGFRALYDKAGLPASTFPAFREALEAMREDGFMFEPGGASRLKRRIIERVLTRCESESAGRDRAAADAAAPLRRRGRARGGAAVLRRTGRGRPDRGRCRLASGRGVTSGRSISVRRMRIRILLRSDDDEALRTTRPAPSAGSGSPLRRRDDAGFP